MRLRWEKCRLILCLFDKDSTQFPFYVQAAVMASFYITTMLIELKLYPRWKLRAYIEQSSFDNDSYLCAWKQIHKCDVEIRPISLPTNKCNKCWFTCLRFIEPILDESLNAFRLLDVHYLWTRNDVKHIVKALVNWESSNKRCQIWMFRTPNCMRPFAGGSFGLNLQKDALGVKVWYDLEFLEEQLLQMLHPRVDSDLSNIAYGDDEWMIYLLMMFYFRNTEGGGVDLSKVYLLCGVENGYYSIAKRYTAHTERWSSRYIKIATFINCHNKPHLLNDTDLLDQLYK